MHLYVEYFRYDRYESSGLIQLLLEAETEREAFSKLATHLNLYIDEDSVFDEVEYPEISYIVAELIDSNGDGCDYIQLLKNVTTDTTYINEGDYLEVK